MIKQLISAFIVAISLLFFFCTGNVAVTDGGGTEITGYLVTSDALPAGNATVWLINPIFADTFITITDPSGKYVFKEEIPDGRYTLQGIRDSLACIIFNLRYEQPFPVRTDTLKYTGWIHASAYIDNSTLRQGIDVYIPGTSFTGKTDSSGVITFWHIPPGNYEVVFDRHGYVRCTDSVHVLAGQVDTAGPVKMIRDLSIPVEIPVPTGLQAEADTFLGTVKLSWNEIEQSIQGYYVRIIDTTIDHYPEDGRTRFTRNASFTDTIFEEKKIDTVSARYRIYQVCTVDGNSNKGQWGQRCSLYVKKPVIPPAPSCSLAYNPGNLSISVFTSVARLWWIDSLVIYRSVLSSQKQLIAVQPVRNQCWSDLVNSIPVSKDSTVPITYTVYTKSIYGNLSSSSSQRTITIDNPYLLHKIGKPSTPQGVRPEEEFGMYVITIPAANSPLPDDTVEYRLIVSTETDTLHFFTSWYTIPAIEVLFQKECRYFLQSQIRSRRLPDLQSEFSDTLSFTVHREHSISKPSTPSGKSIVTHATPCPYISYCSDSCSNGHAISIRYVLSYQGETASDSTEWLSVPNQTATIFWTKPGIAYLRSQARCSANPLIVSPWSDALVVTVE